MTWRVWRNRLRSWFKRERLDSELVDELAHHRDLLEQRLRAEGMSQAEAGSEAMRRFGNVTLSRERSYDEWGFAAVESVYQDLRYALRGLRRSKVFTLTAVLTLGLGLGFNTMLFTVFNAYALRPIAARDPHSLFELGWRGKNTSGSHLSWREYRAVAARKDVFSDSFASASVYGTVNQSMWVGEMVSGNYFEMLGAGTALGRPLTPRDTAAPGASPVMVISHSTWKRSFDARTDVIGSKVTLNGQVFEIAGVTHPAFGGLGETPGDFWIPLTMYSAVKQGEDLFGASEPRKILFVGRLLSQLSPAQGAEALTPQMTSFAQDRHEPADGLRVELASRETAVPLSPELLLALSPIFCAFFLVLAAACANVSNMVLARSLARQREFGIRISIGAGRGRLIRQLLTECLVLALGAGTAGLGIAYYGLDLSQKIFFATAPGDFVKLVRLVPLTPDYRVFAAILGACMLSAVLFGLLPALQATRPALVEVMRGELTKRLDASRMRAILVAGQVVVSTVLLIGSLVFARNSAKLEATNVGLNIRNIVHLDTGIPEPRAAQVIEAAGWKDVVAVRRPPLHGPLSKVTVIPEGGSEPQIAGYNAVEPGYFPLLEVPITRGRNFTRAEALSESAVVIVSEATAQKFWPGTNPLGKTLRLSPPRERFVDEIPGITQALVIGIAKDVTSGYVFQGTDQTCVYFPTSSASKTGSSLLVRLDHGEPDTLRDAVQRRFPSVPVGALRVSDVLAMHVLPFRIASWIGSALGLLALALTVSGMYGVMTFLVAQRRREIGIRMALGATVQSVLALILRQSLRLTVAGMFLGSLFCWGAGRVVTALIPFRNTLESGTTDFLLAASMVLVAAGLAVLLPSRRAAKVDPASTLRMD